MNVREMDFWSNSLRILLGNKVHEDVIAGGAGFYVDVVIDEFNKQYETNYHALVDEKNKTILILGDSDEGDLVKYLTNMIKVSIPVGIDIQIYQRID